LLGWVDPPNSSGHMSTTMPATRGTPMIYIVDDEESVRKGLSRLMRSAGMPYRDFASAEQFLAELDPQQAGCVLLDITMAGLTGLQLQSELQKRRINLPIIAVSARDDADTSSRARQLGARFFLRKPVDDQALLDAIRWVLEGDRSQPIPKTESH
jgi:two-component system response regulator FixJ